MSKGEGSNENEEVSNENKKTEGNIAESIKDLKNPTTLALKTISKVQKDEKKSKKKKSEKK